MNQISAAASAVPLADEAMRARARLAAAIPGYVEDGYIEGPVVDLAASYDHYFGSGLYARRYPRPNPNMLRLVRGLLPPQGDVLDFGCGTGRYAAPLLAAGARLVCYDISPVAVSQLACHHGDAVVSGRLRPVAGTLNELARTVSEGSIDLALLMFGVLGHVRGAARRLETLRFVSRLLRPGGKMVVTVPNASRRFAAEQAACAPLIERGELEPGDILYQRHSDTGPVGMYYHLFTADRFAGLLDQAGLEVCALGAESVIPERAVLGWSFAARIDRALMALLPLRLAYGFVATVRRR